jgi:acyl-CoA thioesterase YciA
LSDSNNHKNYPEALRGKSPTLVVIPMPKDMNTAGNIFGGWLMSQMDLAAADKAYEVAKGRVVTRAVDSMEFPEPVFTGDKLCLFTEVKNVGRTSISVEVESWAVRRMSGEYVKVTTATFIFVKIGDDHKPVPIGKDE